MKLEAVRQIWHAKRIRCSPSWLAWDVAGLIEAARRVPARLYRATWQDVERYSKRQDAHMRMGGFVGVAEYDPVPVALLPFLKWGELLHLGKASAFGLGKYTIQAVA